MKIIQDELNSEGDQVGEIAEYKLKIAKSKISGVALERAQKELQRLEKMMPQTAEASVIRTYLDTLVGLPWAKRSRDVLDLPHSEEILNEDHYGLEKVKERILEYLAVRKLTKNRKVQFCVCLGLPASVRPAL